MNPISSTPASIYGFCVFCGLTADAEDFRDRTLTQVGEFAEQLQKATEETVEIAYVDQGYTGQEPLLDAAEHGIDLMVMRLPQAKRGSGRASSSLRSNDTCVPDKAKCRDAIKSWIDATSSVGMEFKK